MATLHTRSFLRRLPRSSPGVRIASALTFALLGFFALLTSPSAQPPVPPTTWYVDAAQSQQTQDGLTWATAFTNLNYPLDSYVQPGDRIFVREGIYVPPPNGFVVDTSVKIYGGFLGTEQTPETRLGAAANTILEGIINQGTGERAKHVVRVLGVAGNPGVLIDGFTIRNGNTLGGSVLSGGGIYALTSDLDLEDCTFWRTAPSGPTSRRPTGEGSTSTAGARTSRPTPCTSCLACSTTTSLRTTAAASPARSSRATS